MARDYSRNLAALCPHKFSIGGIDFDNRLARGMLRAATAKKEHGSFRAAKPRKLPWLFRQNAGN
jgi:hypothetical protein